MSSSRDFRDLDGADPWKLLGVGRDADADEIKRSYRRLSRSHHADVGGDAAKQVKLNRAYEILSDPTRRADYALLLNQKAERPAQENKRSEQPAADPFEWSSGPAPNFTERPRPPRQDVYTPPPQDATTFRNPYGPHQGDRYTAPTYRDPSSASSYQNPYQAPPYRDPYSTGLSRSGGINTDALVALVTSIICPPASIILAVRGLRKIKRTGQRGKTLAWLALFVSVAFPTWAVVNNLLNQ
jgi:curved DNA-binding protein CbpA